MLDCCSLKVIGDKKGGKTSKILIDPSNMRKLEVISQLVQVPMKFIHVVRNPFDNISTMTLRKAHQRNAARREGFKVSCFLSVSLIKMSSPAPLPDLYFDSFSYPVAPIVSIVC